MDEYAEEFYLLLTRNEIYDSEIQIVSRFIGGLRPQLQNAMAQFDPTSVAEAHRRATSFEQQLRSNWSSVPSRSRFTEQTTAASSASTRGVPETMGSGVNNKTQDEDQTSRRPHPDLMLCVVTLVENGVIDKRLAPTRSNDVDFL